MRQNADRAAWPYTVFDVSRFAKRESFSERMSRLFGILAAGRHQKKMVFFCYIGNMDGKIEKNVRNLKAPLGIV